MDGIRFLITASPALVAFAYFQNKTERWSVEVTENHHENLP